MTVGPRAWLISTISVVLLVGLALDLQGTGTPGEYSLSASRAAMLVQAPVWVTGLVTIARSRGAAQRACTGTPASLSGRGRDRRECDGGGPASHRPHIPGDHVDQPCPVRVAKTMTLSSYDRAAWSSAPPHVMSRSPASRVSP